MAKNLVIVEAPTKSKFLDAFKQHLQDNDFSPLTVLGYLSDVKVFCAWFEKSNGRQTELELITPTDMRGYRQYLLRVEKRSANTVNRKLAALSTLMRWGVDCGRIASDPMSRVKTVRVTRGAPTPKWLDKTEQIALQRAIERDLQLAKIRFPRRWVTRQRDASLVVFLLHTGLRLNEATALQTSDIQISSRKGSVLIRQGKGGKQRSVPLNTEARKALQDWYAVRPESEFVWTEVEGNEGSSLTGRTIQRMLERYAIDANLESLSPHILRHSFAKNLVNAGVGLEKVAALLGHKNLNAMRVYVAPGEKDLETAMEELV